MGRSLIFALVLLQVDAFSYPWGQKKTSAVSAPEDSLSDRTNTLGRFLPSLPSFHLPYPQTLYPSTAPTVPATPTPLEFKSKIVDWWNSWQNASSEESTLPTDAAVAPSLSPSKTPTTSTVSSSSTRKPPSHAIRPDPRLVPPVIYDMECQPGVAFHLCIQDCTANAKDTTSERGGTYKEAESFKTCVKNCTDGLLKSPGPGCLTEEGYLIQRDPNGIPKTYHPSTIQVRAWLYRIRHAFSIPFGGVIATAFFSCLSIACWAGAIYLIISLKLHEFLFILLNGVPTSSQTTNEAESLRWEKASALNAKLLNGLQAFESNWKYVERFSLAALHYLVAFLRIFVPSGGQSDGDIYDDAALRQEADVLQRLKDYELETF